MENCRYTRRRPFSLHQLWVRLRWSRDNSQLPGPPALKKANRTNPKGSLWFQGLHTHTVPLCGARANDLNRYLKSLRNKRKKHSKSSAKRAREKGRSRKSEYLALDWGRETSLKSNLKAWEKAQETTKSARRKVGGQGGVSTCVCPCVCMNT